MSEGSSGAYAEGLVVDESSVSKAIVCGDRVVTDQMPAETHSRGW